MGWRWLTFSVLIAACSAGPDEVPVHCPGDRPALADCFTGRNFADCGGTGEPAFGCSDVDCRWFVAGCAPEQYVLSSCPPSDLCCHDDRPFIEGELGDGGAPSALPLSLYGNGTLPWNRNNDMVIDVEIDDGLVTGPTNLSCMNGLDAGDNPCDQDTASVAAGDLLEIWLGELGHWGSLVTIEIDTAAADGPIARACELPYTDDLRFTCPPWDSVDCAVSGVVELSSLDATGPIAGAVDLTFASGARLSGTFSAE